MKKEIILRDKIYGNFKIREPIILELLYSKPIQRLKGINQFGIPDKYYHKKNFNRYEHSVGVMLLIRRLGGSLEEQVAGLLHDVSHTAFSHVIDWVIGDMKKESYQDNQHFDILNSGQIKKILHKYLYDPKIISDYHRFKLLERETPDLCADRVDYALREAPIDIARKLSKFLINIDNEIVFKDKKSAYSFAINFLKLQKEHWGGKEAVSRYRYFSEALKIAIKENILKLYDFSEDDNYVINKLEKFDNIAVKSILRILSKKKLVQGKSREIVHKKFRYTDPRFVYSGKVVRLSEVSPQYKKTLEKHKKINNRGIKVSI